MADKQHDSRQKSFFWPLYGFSLLLVTLFIIFFIKTFLTTPVSSNAPQCPEDFLYYANSAYSICYPKGWTAHKTDDVTYPDGSVSTNIVAFINDKNPTERIFVIPNRGLLVSKEPCLTQETNLINGYNVERITYRDATVKGTCGNIVSYNSIVETELSTGAYKKGIVISYVTAKGVSLTDEQYSEMENSLKVIIQ